MSADLHVRGMGNEAKNWASVPPNLQFYVDDLEDDWTYSYKFDFIFARMLTGALSDWPKFFKQGFEYVVPHPRNLLPRVRLQFV